MELQNVNLILNQKLFKARIKAKKEKLKMIVEEQRKARKEIEFLMK